MNNRETPGWCSTHRVSPSRSRSDCVPGRFAWATTFSPGPPSECRGSAEALCTNAQTAPILFSFSPRPNQVSVLVLVSVFNCFKEPALCIMICWVSVTRLSLSLPRHPRSTDFSPAQRIVCPVKHPLPPAICGVPPSDSVSSAFVPRHHLCLSVQVLHVVANTWMAQLLGLQEKGYLAMLTSELDADPFEEPQVQPVDSLVDEDMEVCRGL